MRGYFGVAIYRSRDAKNVGGLLRSAAIYGAAFIATVGRRYTHEAADTCKTPRHVPLFHFDTVEQLLEHRPMGCPLIGVELDQRAEGLLDFEHPQRAVYLLGAEDDGLPPEVIELCHQVVQIETPPGRGSLNVATAGSIVLYDRYIKTAIH